MIYQLFLATFKLFSHCSIYRQPKFLYIVYCSFITCTIYGIKMAKLTPDAVKFIVKTKNTQNVTFDKLAQMILEKFDINATPATVRHRYIQHRYDHIIDKIQETKGE